MREVMLFGRRPGTAPIAKIDDDAAVDQLIAVINKVADDLKPVAAAKRAARLAKEQPKMDTNIQDIVKHDPVTTDVITLAKRDSLSVRDAAYRVIEREGGEIRKREPSLTRQQAELRFLSTKEGGDVYAIYKSRGAHLDAESWTKAQGPRAGDMLADVAQAISKRDGIPFDAALLPLIEQFPHLYQQYRRERL